MTFEAWCEHHNHNPQDNELRERWETFVWYTETYPNKEMTHNEQD